jgi:predicted patatin/cPLA2 family phospholipase
VNTQLLANLHQRSTERQAGRSSQLVTGLVVEGGGMRGLYSIAVLQALHEAGLAGAFDHVFGASAGALNASCFLAGQCADAIAAYLEDAASVRFINWLRWWKIVDVDFLVDHVMTRHRPVCLDKVLRSSSQLHVILTDCATRTAHVVTNRDAGLVWSEVLRATMALPALYGRPVPLNGKTYMDGCMVEPVPIQRAIAAGCTDILVITTRLPSFRTHFGPVLEFLERPLLRQYPAGIQEVARADRAAFNATMELLEHPERLAHGVRLRVIHPSDIRRMVWTTTIHRDRLKRCANMGTRDAKQFLHSSPSEFEPTQMHL